MRVKLFIICVIVSMSVIMTSCEGKENTGGGEFTFTETEMGFSANYIFNDVSTDSIYVIGGQINRPETYIKTIDAKTFECSEFEHTLVSDDILQVYALHPNKNGYWAFIGDSMGGVHLLQYFSADFEPVSTLDITDYVEKTQNPFTGEEVYSYHFWGSTAEGHIVISQAEDTIFTLNVEGDIVQTWNLTVNAADSRRRFYRAYTYGEEIYCFSTDSNSLEVKKLLPNGSIEALFTREAQYSNYFVGEDGRIYAAGFDNKMYVLDAKGNAEFLFDYSEIGANSYCFGLVVLGGDRYIMVIDNRVFLVTKGQIDTDDTTPTVITQKELTLACYGESGILRQNVYDFNRDSEEYQIKILDYSQFEDGVTRLNLDILAGVAPDMVWWDTTFLNLFQSAVYSKSEQLVDLYTLLDKDDEIGRSIFLPNLLGAVESGNGALYELPLEFTMYVVAGSVDVVGTEPGWTPDEFFELLERYPNADNPFGTAYWGTLLSLMIYNNSDAYIDWENGRSHFDSEEFMRFLEIAKINTGIATESILPVKSIKAGRQLLSYNILSDVSSIQKFTGLFGGEVNLIGFPTSRGVGNAFILERSVSIFAQSGNIDACWKFIRGLAAYEEQIEGATFFPANYEALQERLKNPAEYEEEGAMLIYRDDEGDQWSVTFTDTTPEESEQVRRLIESCDRVHRENRAVIDIVIEEVQVYFSGDRTLEETVRIIQSRVQTYVSEQS